MEGPSIFEGFGSQAGPGTALPEQFFSELLSQVDHLGELKATLLGFHLLERMEGSIRFLEQQDWLADQQTARNFGTSRDEQEPALDEALRRAVARGTFLQATADSGEVLYFLNSPKGRAAVEGLRLGRWSPQEREGQGLDPRPETPNIYALYEANIGPLTPMLAETLRDAEQEYEAEWIRDALRIAVENNVRKWRYVEAILKSWQESGRDDRGDTKNAEEDRRKYVEGQFSDFIER